MAFSTKCYSNLQTQTFCPSVEETSPLGEEMVTVRDLSLQCLERDIQPMKRYSFKIKIASLS